MTLDVNNPYLRTKVMTASPEELRLMLIEGAIRFLREGRNAMVQKEYEAQYEALSDAKNIVLELMGSMRHEIAPELCANMENLYTYMYRTLVEAGLERDPKKVDEVVGLMQYERETWIMLMEQLAKEHMASATAASAASATSIPASSEHQPLSLEG